MPGPVMPRATSGLGDVLRRLGIQLPVTPEAGARQPWQDMPGSQPRPVLDNILGALVDFPRGMVTGGGAEPGMSWENAGAAVGALAPLLGPLLGKIVYHGSPHVFDKFDMSKVGTGEGAQALRAWAVLRGHSRRGEGLSRISVRTLIGSGAESVRHGSSVLLRRGWARSQILRCRIAATGYCELGS